MATARTFARIDLGRVVEIIGPMFYEVDAPAPPDPDNVPPEWPTFRAGEEVPIEVRFTSEIVATLVDVTDVDVEVGYTYANGLFKPYAPPLPSPSEILAANTGTRDALLRIATQRIAPLQDALDLGEATAEETTALTLWKQYRVAVNRVDLSLAAPQWPAVPA